MMDKNASAFSKYCWILRFFTFNYIIVGASFLLKPDLVILLLNESGAFIASVLPQLAPWTSTPLPFPVEKFYVVLTVAMMAMLVATGILGSIYPKTRGYLLIHVTSKFTSVAVFTDFYLESRQFPYLAGALVDAWVIAVILIFYVRTLKLKGKGGLSHAR